MRISPARVAAFDALTRIDRDHAFSASILPAVEAGLSDKDSALCHELVLGVLRRQIYLDRLIDGLASGKKIDPAIRLTLRLGLYQLLFLDRIPPHAAINDSVELTRRAKKTSAKGFVNAILRSIQRETPELAFTTEVERIAVETSHPEWLIERWIEQFGMAEAAALADANNRTPRIAFRRTVKGRIADLSAYTPSRYAKDAYIAERMTSELSSLAATGMIYFQDEGSQIVADAVPAADKFLDVCAAPGGKTTQIAARASGSSLLVAGDLYWTRVEFLRQNCIAQGADLINVVQYDAMVSLPFAENSFDSVLVDAPCSGTGTIAHNPEIRYFLKTEDFAELSDKQLRILENASKLVAKNGTLIYSTCSLEREENEKVCERFETGGGFVRTERDVLSLFITNEGFVRTFPHRDGIDGFFIAAFRRL